jgi:hypothetical protein
MRGAVDHHGEHMVTWLYVKAQNEERLGNGTFMQGMEVVD